MGRLLCVLTQLWIIALFARVILSYFPLSPGGAMASVASALHTVTEPVLGPVRRLLPMAGPIDFSPIIVFFLVQFLVQPIVCGI